MSGFNFFSAGVAGVVAFSLHGCGGGGGPTPAPAPTPTEKPPVIDPTTATTTTTAFTCDGVKVVPAGSDSDEGRLVDELNRLYTGYDVNDPTSPTGVTLRVADDFQMFCGTPCYDGNPDCRVSSSLYNSKMMYEHDSHKPAVTMDRDAGIIFNQNAIETSTGKCAYMYDGATFGRVNGGCGCAARQHGCGEQGAYWNQDCQYGDPDRHLAPILSTCHDNTDTSPDVAECLCSTRHRRTGTPGPEEAKTTDQQCVWKGAGLYPPHTIQNEFHEFVAARIASQETTNGIEIVDLGNNKTETRYKTEYWNEVVVDAHVLGDMLSDPNGTNTDAVSAFVYFVNGHYGQGTGKQKALDMRKQALRDYGYPLIPIVEFDVDIDVRCGGVFREATDLGPDPDPCAAEWEKCYGGGVDLCCQEGLVCRIDNPSWGACRYNNSWVDHQIVA